MTDFEEVLTVARVVFRKSISDGNYGTEAAEVTLDVPVDGTHRASEEAVASTLETARRLVHAELARSPSGSVRRALEPPKPIAPSNYDDDEDLPL